MRKIQCKFSKEICIQKFGLSKGYNIWKERQQKWRETLVLKGMWLAEKDTEDFMLYKNRVWAETRQNIQNVPNIEKRGLEFHLDHKFSIKSGFENNVPVHIIGGLKI